MLQGCIFGPSEVLRPGPKPSSTPACCSLPAYSESKVDKSLFWRKLAKTFNIVMKTTVDSISQITYVEFFDRLARMKAFHRLWFIRDNLNMHPACVNRTRFHVHNTPGVCF